jgi:hypothetical protein
MSDSTPLQVLLQPSFTQHFQCQLTLSVSRSSSALNWAVPFHETISSSPSYSRYRLPGISVPLYMPAQLAYGLVDELTHVNALGLAMPRDPFRDSKFRMFASITPHVKMPSHKRFSEKLHSCENFDDDGSNFTCYQT